MKHLKLNAGQNKTDYIDVFAGYNHNNRIQDNEFYDMKNLSSDGYPVISQRAKRGYMSAGTYPAESEGTPVGAGYKDGMLFACEYHNGQTRQINLSRNATGLLGVPTSSDYDGMKRQIVSIGSYIIVFPDKIYYNTVDGSNGYIDASVSASVCLKPCDQEGNVAHIDYVGTSAPESVTDGYTWLDVSKDVPELKVYYAAYRSWALKNDNYILLASSSASLEGFNEDDAVEISNYPQSDLNKSYIIEKIVDNTHVVLIGSMSLSLLSSYMFSVIDNRYDIRNNQYTICVKSDYSDFLNKNIVVGAAHGTVVASQLINPYYTFKIDTLTALAENSTYLSIYLSGATPYNITVNEDAIVTADEYICFKSDDGSCIYAQVTSVEDSSYYNADEDGISIAHHVITSGSQTFQVSTNGDDVTADDLIGKIYKIGRTGGLKRSSVASDFYTITAAELTSTSHSVKYWNITLDRALEDSADITTDYPCYAMKVITFNRDVLTFIDEKGSGTIKLYHATIDQTYTDCVYLLTLEDEISNVNSGDAGVIDISSVYSVYSAATIARESPDFDFVVSANNRLWGCKYDTDAGINMIYASKLGDFKNWNYFGNTAMDSWYGQVGSDGPFTGAITYNGYPMFFKNDWIYTIYGSAPSSFAYNEDNYRGVQEGSDRSLAIVNEVLYYKSSNGILAYTGSMPTNVSGALGSVDYRNATGFRYKDKYYVSMQRNDTNEWELFAYDTAKGYWHKEDNLHIELFANIPDTDYTVGADPTVYHTNENVYFIDADHSLSTIGAYQVLVGDKVTATSDDTEWMFETGVLGCTDIKKKYFNRIAIKFDSPIGSTMEAYVKYDADEEWTSLFSISGEESLTQFTYPVKLRRADHFRLRFEGIGDSKIYAISKTYKEGSDENA